MKKLILGIALLCMTSCGAQNLEGGTYVPAADTTTRAILTQVDEKTASFITKEHKVIFETDSKPDMIKGNEYIIRIQFERADFKRNGVTKAKLVGYTISPEQAQRNAAAISRGL